MYKCIHINIYVYILYLRKKERPVPIVNSEFSAILCVSSKLCHTQFHAKQQSKQRPHQRTALSWALYQKDPYNM